jgi:hypothetical protein
MRQRTPKAKLFSEALPRVDFGMARGASPSTAFSDLLHSLLARFNYMAGRVREIAIRIGEAR